MEESRFELFSGLMNSSAKSIQRIKAVKMKKYHLSAAHTTCLCRLGESGNGLTQRELVGREHMDRAQISRVLKDLQARGYVTAMGEEGHYKRRYVLTGAGREVASEIQDIIRDIYQFVSADLPPEDVAVFYRTLRAIARNLERAVDAYL